MFTPQEIENFSITLSDNMNRFENQVMSDIIRRLKINGTITRSADWQIYRLTELGILQEDIKKAIKTSLKLSDKDVNALYSEIMAVGYAHDKAIYKAVGVKQIPLAGNAELQQLISAIAEQTAGEINNITRTMGFAEKTANGIRFKPISQYYQDTLDTAMLNIATGTKDYNTVLRESVKAMTNSGIRTVDYASGYNSRIEVATRKSIMTGFSQLTAKYNEQNAKALGTSDYEVSYHIGARPSHQAWQGKVYSESELASVCGLGTATGLCGVHCYHDYYPFVKGISERIYSDAELKKMNAEENKPKQYGDKEYTTYQALQRQRQLETAMRSQRQNIKLLQEGGADEQDIIIARASYYGTSQEYTQFSQSIGLPQQRDRVTIDGLGNIGKGKRTQRR